MNSPCNGCMERHKGCWSDCEKYKAYDETNVRRREEHRRERTVRQYMADHIIDNAIKREKKKNVIKGGGY